MLSFSRKTALQGDAESAERAEATRLMSYQAAGASLIFGCLLIFARGQVLLGSLQFVISAVFIAIPYALRVCPGGFSRWRPAVIMIAFWIQLPVTWALGPTASQTFYFDGVTTLAVGYLLSLRGLLWWLGLKIGIQLLTYQVEVSLGYSTWSQTFPIAQGTAGNLVLVGVMTFLLKQLSRRGQLKLDEQQAELSAARTTLEVRVEGLRAEKAKVDAYGKELQEVNQALTVASELRLRFLANMSHEIRTPMNAVLGMSDLLLDSELDEEQIELAGVIQSSSTALLRVLNDILDVSKLQEGQLEVHPEPTELCSLLSASVRVFETAAQYAGLRIEHSVDPELPEWVRIDGGRVGQIVANYLSNALKFTQRGSVCCRAVRPREGWLRVEVVDTGLGIPAAEIERLFRPFEQLNSSAHGVKGTGLGLSISRELAHRMGGSVGADSVFGQGATFWLEIPAPTADVAEVRASQSDPELALAGLRALVVDDNVVNRSVAVRHLRRLGMVAVEAINGEDALRRLKVEGAFDVVLMDCHMPRMDGYEATQAIRRDARFAKLPVIALTASALEEDVLRSHEAGMNTHLAKPYSGRDLSRVLRATLQAAGA